MRKLFQYILAHLRITELLNNQYEIKQKLATQQTEILKGLIFNNTITDSEWLQYKSFSPGAWAADYGLLYTLYRVLNGMKPQSIIEFGLGQSSKMIHQYAKHYGAKAITCEHDSKWIDFFRNECNEKYLVNIKSLELETINYKGYETLTYKNILQEFENDKFELILVDGPFGSDHYSRPQIVDLAKNNLHSRFCIIIDDCERQGEQETTKEVLEVLKEQGVECCFTTYSASKRHTLICSSDLKFLTSL